MADWRFTWVSWVQLERKGFRDPVEPPRDFQSEGMPWPMPAQSIMRVVSEEWPKYAVDVELRLDALDEPVVTGVAVRPRVPLKARGRRAGIEPPNNAEWPEGTEPLPLSLRDVRRLPLDRIATAAVVYVRQAKEEPSPDRMQPVAEALSLPGRPTGRNKERFYRAVAELYRQWTLKGLSPAKELAKRKRVSENTAHQWIFKARRFGYLEPSPRSQKKEKIA